MGEFVEQKCATLCLCPLSLCPGMLYHWDVGIKCILWSTFYVLCLHYPSIVAPIAHSYLIDFSCQ